MDGEDISDIEASWAGECINENGGNLLFNVTGSLTQISEYEAEEFSRLALRVNGTTTVLDTITSDRNGAVSPTTGTQQYSTEVSLNSGSNTIELMCFNNLKTFENELTGCSFNRLETSPVLVDNDTSELCIPIKIEDSRFITACL